MIKTRILLPLLMIASSQVHGGTLTATYMGFNPADGKADLQQNISYQLPDAATFGPGPYPVFVWTSGAIEPYNDPMSLTFVAQMAKRGFLGATVQYSNTNAVEICTSYTARAQAVYDITKSTSAASVICHLPGASCSKGIVTAGISEGGMLAVLAKNYAPQVAATFAMSVSDYNQQGHVNLAACMDKSHTAIPANRLTIVNGQSDPLFGGQTPLQNVSGYSCPSGTLHCWSTSGSGAGWYIVQNSQVKDAVADHCYQMVGGCTGTSFDPSWIPPATYDWSFGSNLDWLATFGVKRNFSPTGN